MRYGVFSTNDQTGQVVRLYHRIRVGVSQTSEMEESRIGDGSFVIREVGEENSR